MRHALCGMPKKMKWVVPKTSLESRMGPRLHDSQFTALITTVNLKRNVFPNNPQNNKPIKELCMALPTSNEIHLRYLQLAQHFQV